MLIAYLTTDEVNEHLALQIALESGETLCPLSPCDAPPDEDFDAAIYDWDYLPAERQQEVLAQLLAGQAPFPAAVHGYNMDDSCFETLRKHNVAVYRTLQSELFRRLALEGRQVRAAQAARSRTEKREASLQVCFIG